MAKKSPKPKNQAEQLEEIINKDAAAIEEVLASKTDSEEVEVQKEKALFQYLVPQFIRVEGWRQQYESLWVELYAAFVAGSIGIKTPTRSKVFVPKVYTATSVAHSKLVSFIPDSGSFFDVKAVAPSEEGIAQNIHRLLESQLNKTDFLTQYAAVCHSLLLYGSGFWMVDWMTKRGIVYERKKETVEKLDAQGNTVLDVVVHPPVRKLTQTESRPRVKALNIMDVFPFSPDYSSIQDSPGVYVRTFISKDEFKTLADAGYFYNKERALAGSGSNAYQQSRQKFKTAYGENTFVDNDMIEIIEFWGEYDWDEDGFPEERRVCIANRSVIVKNDPNPFEHQQRPVIKVVYTDLFDGFYGMSMCEPVLSEQYEINVLRQQRIDNVNIGINRPVKYIEDVGIDTRFLQMAPFQLIPLKNLNDIAFETVPDITQNAYTEADKISDEFDSATVPPTLAGTADVVSGNTVGATRIATTQALEKFGTVAKAIQDQGIKKILEYMYSMDKQFLTDSTLTTGFYGEIFPNKELLSSTLSRTNINFDMSVLSEMISKDTQIASDMAFYNAAKEDLAPQSKEAVLKRVYGRMGNDQNEIQVVATTLAPTAMGTAGVIPGAAPELPPAPPEPIVPTLDTANGGVGLPDTGVTA